MVKKFSDLKKGDSIYYFNKNLIEDGYQEKVLASDFEEGFALFLTETIDDCIISFDKKVLISPFIHQDIPYMLQHWKVLKRHPRNT